MTYILYKTIIQSMKKLLLLTLLTTFLFSCTTKKTNKSIAVFIPGIMANSPTYALLDEGVRAYINEYNQDKTEEEKVSVFTMEAGTNQAQWQEKLTLLAARQEYDVIISSNSSLPELALPILKKYPNQKFIFLDASYKDNQNIYTASYNQAEQAFLSGYSASLMSKSHKIGLIAAQEYPVMMQEILPSYILGAKTAFEQTQVEFRVVGNWYDANQGLLLADSLIKNNCDVILPICGGAAQGVIKSAINNKKFIAWFDNNGFSYAPNTVISSSIMKQKELAYKTTKDFLDNNISWGKSDSFGIKEGYIDFIQDDPLYLQTVPSDVQEKIKTLMEQLNSGSIIIDKEGIKIL